MKMAISRRSGWAYAVVAAALVLALAARAEARAARTFGGELTRLAQAAQLDPTVAAESRQTYRDARAAAGRLTGTRRTELQGALRTVDGIAARRQLTPERVTPLALTLERNREWWTTRGPLRAGARVTFPGSELVWQAVPGQGIQIHPLANFGKLNGFWLGGRRKPARAGRLLDELLALAVPRAGGLAWEYYFSFGGGQPPWVSGLAQGTAVQSITRVAAWLGREAEVFPIAAQGLGVFATPAPEGVQVRTPEGSHYALYSFNPGLFVLNGFVQSLVGLFDYTQLTGDERGRALFAAGDAAARVEVPLFDTGAWSLYARGTTFRESDLSYHILLRDFMNGLCNRTAEPVYCVAATHFSTYLTQPPALVLRTTRVRAGSVTPIAFELSKLSSVGMVVARDGRPIYTRAPVSLAYGRHTLSWPVPRRAGVYTVRLGAKDLAGNSAVVDGTVEVLPARRRSPLRRG
jgi:hypothetical protein